MPRSEHWQCIGGCGSCCRLDPALRGDAIEALDRDQQQLYFSMVGDDGWCRHFDTGSRRCRIYAERPDFCRVDQLVALFGLPGDDPDALAISSCKQQIRAELGGRHRVMRRFLRTIRHPS
ncbi:MAG: YkgJ family cysteine cluster protein [Cyanobium sp. CZS 25K]|nr:YkgJ family cysteine cluster protein [Cyanobium sp. CZS25K]